MVWQFWLLATPTAPQLLTPSLIFLTPSKEGTSLLLRPLTRQIGPDLAAMSLHTHHQLLLSQYTVNAETINNQRITCLFVLLLFLVCNSLLSIESGVQNDTYIQQTQSGCVAEEATRVCLAVVEHSGPCCPRNHLFSDVDCIFLVFANGGLFFSLGMPSIGSFDFM